MNVVDSSAWLSYFAGDKNSGAFAKPIETIGKLLVPSITITEVFKCIMRQRDEDAALEAIVDPGYGFQSVRGRKILSESESYIRRTGSARMLCLLRKL